MTREEFLWCYEKTGKPRQVRVVAGGEVVQGKLTLFEEMPGIVLIETGLTALGNRYVAIASIDIIGGFKAF